MGFFIFAGNPMLFDIHFSIRGKYPTQQTWWISESYEAHEHWSARSWIQKAGKLSVWFKVSTQRTHYAQNPKELHVFVYWLRSIASFRHIPCLWYWSLKKRHYCGLSSLLTLYCIDSYHKFRCTFIQLYFFPRVILFTFFSFLCGGWGFGVGS